MSEAAQRKKTADEIEGEIADLRRRHQLALTEWLATRFENYRRERLERVSSSSGVVFHPACQSRSR
jgi:hypothetical protein